MLDVVLTRARQCATDERSTGRADVQDAGNMKQRAVRRGLEAPPVLVSAPGERDVARVLKCRFADDTGAAVARAQRVRRVMAIEAEDAQPETGQVDRGGAADGSEPGDDDVV